MLEDTQRGREEALRAGRFVGSNLPYGYRWNKQDGVFEIVEAIQLDRLPNWVIPTEFCNNISCSEAG